MASALSALHINASDSCKIQVLAVRLCCGAGAGAAGAGDSVFAGGTGAGDFTPFCSAFRDAVFLSTASLF